MFKLKLNRRNVPENELLSDLKKVANALGIDYLTREQYEQHGNFGHSTIVRRFKKWAIAMEKAGLKVKYPINIPDERLFSNIADVWTSLGRQPKYNDMIKPLSKCSAGTYENRFGTWNSALEKFIAFINGAHIEDGRPLIKQDKISKKTPRNINWRLRAKILIKDNCICKMCGNSPAKDPDCKLHIDHIKPWSKDGETVEENLRTLCHQCNIGKSDIEI